mmetsp:Transcript_112584/g.257880  ORF Transcript_112584/g.257880 Transcript_112584/m.257880 type:complete len:206 (-) Transcript_112584:240-857(-)
MSLIPRQSGVVCRQRPEHMTFRCRGTPHLTVSCCSTPAPASSAPAPSLPPLLPRHRSDGAQLAIHEQTQDSGNTSRNVGEFLRQYGDLMLQPRNVDSLDGLGTGDAGNKIRGRNAAKICRNSFCYPCDLVSLEACLDRHHKMWKPHGFSVPLHNWHQQIGGLFWDITKQEAKKSLKISSHNFSVTLSPYRASKAAKRSVNGVTIS